MSFYSTSSLNLIKLGRVVDDPKQNFSNSIFRVNISDCATNVKYFAMIAPSPYGVKMPEKGSLVLYVNDPVRRIIDVVGDMDERGFDRISEEGETLKSNITAMLPGQVYIGKHGRAYFDGDVKIVSENLRSVLTLDDDDGLAELSGYNLSLHTEDDSIEIFTENSIPAGFGDSLTIQKCLTGTGVPLSKVQLATDGSVLLASGITTAATSAQLLLGVFGDIAIENTIGSIQMLSTGAIETFGSKVSFESTTSFSIESATASIKASTLDITATTNIAGPLSISGSSTFTGLSSFSGMATYAGGISVSGIASFSGGLSITGLASTVGITLPTPLPFAGAVFKATIPVMVNGVLCAIPCI